MKFSLIPTNYNSESVCVCMCVCVCVCVSLRTLARSVLSKENVRGQNGGAGVTG